MAFSTAPVRSVNVDDAEWETRIDAAQDAFMEPAQRIASGTDYGFCAYADAPAAVGGGITWFYWFEDKQRMLSVLRDHALFLNAPRSDMDLTEADTGVKRAIATAHEGEDLEGLRRDLNRCLENASQFEWMGTFRELCESPHPQAKKFRAEFREERELVDDSSAVESDELESFAEFIGRYNVS